MKKGVASPTPRFTDNGNGTVTDKLTGLIWMKDAGVLGTKTWADALTAASGLKSGDAGLTDGSQAGDWRLPNRKELESLVDCGRWNPALPVGHPFTNVQSFPYWSSTNYAFSPTDACPVLFYDGSVGNLTKNWYLYVWCVRGGP